MELEERINILIQAAELAQKGGVLSLDDASLAKQAVDALKNGKQIKTAIDVLVKVAEMGQKKGVYTLRDSHFIYVAVDGIDDVIPAQ